MGGKSPHGYPSIFLTSCIVTNGSLVSTIYKAKGTPRADAETSLGPPDPLEA